MQDRNGFTLIELLVVLVIIGILAAIAIPQFTDVREQAFYAAVKADLRNLAARQELHYATNFTYSASMTALGAVASEGVTVTPTGDATGWSATASHSALGEDEGCAIYFGGATAPTVGTATPSAPGEVACTD